MNLGLKLEPEVFKPCNLSAGDGERAGTRLAHRLRRGVGITLLHCFGGSYAGRLEGSLQQLSANANTGDRRRLYKELRRVKFSGLLLNPTGAKSISLREFEDKLLPDCHIAPMPLVSSLSHGCCLQEWDTHQSVLDALEEIDTNKLNEDMDYLGQVLSSPLRYSSALAILDPYIGLWLMAEKWNNKERGWEDVSDKELENNQRLERLTAIGVANLINLWIKNSVFVDRAPLDLRIITKCPFKFETRFHELSLMGGRLRRKIEECLKELNGPDIEGLVRIRVEFKKGDKQFSDRFIKAGNLCHRFGHGIDTLGQKYATEPRGQDTAKDRKPLFIENDSLQSRQSTEAIEALFDEAVTEPS